MTDGTVVTAGSIRVSAGVRGSRHLLVGLVALVAGALVAVILSMPGPGSGSTAGAPPAGAGPTALLRLPAAAQGPISAALGRDLAGYRMTGLGVENPAQRLSARFGPGGATVAAGRARFEIGLRAVGRGSPLAAVAAVAPVVRAGRVVYARAGMTEVWRNGPLGLEQSFVLSRRPAGTGRLMLAVAVPAGARVSGAAVLLPAGLRYDGLRAVDARGRVLASAMRVSGGRAILSIDDRGAAYPITVDPLVQQAQLIEPGGGASQDAFGYSVAISGSTIVVGAPHVTTDGLAAAGAAYVFQDGSSGWTEVATLTPSDAAALGAFGWSVAISGNTIVVGAPTDQEGGDACTLGTGAAYVFEEPAGGWTSMTQTTELEPNLPCDGTDEADGYSVAIDGSTVVVGAPYTVESGSSPEGAAYVYTLTGAGAVTGTPATLTDAAGSHYATLGWSVAVSGATIVVGAPNYANAPGAAYIYAEPANGWTTTGTPTTALSSTDLGSIDEFGFSVAVDGGTAVVAAPKHSGSDPANPGTVQQEGALYVFVQPSSGWPATMSQTSELSPSDPTSVGYTTLGIGGVAISGSTIVGATDEGTGSVNAGAGYEFVEPAGGWPATMTQTGKLLLTTSATGGFATGVGLSSGGTVVLGAPSATVTGVGGGAAYVFGSGSTTTPPPTTTTTTTTNPAPTIGAGAGGHATVSGDSVSARATCAGAATTSCTLTYSLTSRETTLKGKPVAVAARRKKVKRVTKTVTIGSAHAVLAGGASKTIRLTLNAAGRALLKRFRTLPADLTVSQAQPAGPAKVISVQKVTFHTPKAKRRKKKK